MPIAACQLLALFGLENVSGDQQGSRLSAKWDAERHATATTRWSVLKPAALAVRDPGNGNNNQAGCGLTVEGLGVGSLGGVSMVELMRGESAAAARDDLGSVSGSGGGWEEDAADMPVDAAAVAGIRAMRMDERAEWRWPKHAGNSGAGREEGGEEARERAEEGGDRRGSVEAGRVVGVIPQPSPSSFELLPPEYDESRLPSAVPSSCRLELRWARWGVRADLPTGGTSDVRPAGHRRLSTTPAAYPDPTTPRRARCPSA
uniref:Uncharacterized protein n=1 Tax=Oryza sativa subsp. japonica TaxID=39947 RepID=Q6UU33_ORYSJ|nr:hypothetical protein OSJNBa0096K16.10 [Oryza sativa Japonica Group]